MIPFVTCLDSLTFLSRPVNPAPSYVMQGNPSPKELEEMDLKYNSTFRPYVQSVINGLVGARMDGDTVRIPGVDPEEPTPFGRKGEALGVFTRAGRHREGKAASERSSYSKGCEWFLHFGGRWTGLFRTAIPFSIGAFPASRSTPFFGSAWPCRFQPAQRTSSSTAPRA